MVKFYVVKLVLGTIVSIVQVSPHLSQSLTWFSPGRHIIVYNNGKMLPWQPILIHVTTNSLQWSSCLYSEDNWMCWRILSLCSKSRFMSILALFINCIINSFMNWNWVMFSQQLLTTYLMFVLGISFISAILTIIL